jgi:hypothetical protein
MTTSHRARRIKDRKFPALTFEEALTIPDAIQKYASGQKVRRLTLFEKLSKEPDSAESKLRSKRCMGRTDADR